MSSLTDSQIAELKAREAQVADSWKGLMDLAHEVAGAKEWDWYRSLLRRASAVTGNVFELLLTVDILVLIDDAEFALEALERSIAGANDEDDRTLLSAMYAMWAGPKRQEKILGGLDPAILNGFWNQSPSALALDARIGEFVGLISSYGQSSRQTHSANTESAIPTSAKPSCYSACVEEAVHPGIINELHPLPMAVYCNQLHTGTLVELTAYIRMADESADASGWVAAYHYSEEGRGRFIHEYVLLHVGLRCTAIRTSSYEQGQLRENLQRFELDQDYGTLVPVGDERPEGTFMLPLRQIIAFEQITRGVDFQWLYGSNYSGRQELKDNANLVVGDMNGFARTEPCDMNCIALLSGVWSSRNRYRRDRGEWVRGWR